MAIPKDWNRDYCRLTQALALMPTKADGSYAWGNLKVAHLDTGYRRVPALGFATPIGSGDSAWVKPSLGRDFFDDKADPKDPLIDTPWQPPGHGTRTSSALAGEDPAAGFRGLAPRLPVIPYRVNDDVLIGGRSVKAIGKAIMHAIDENGCQLVAISQGFPIVDSGEMGAAVDYAYEAGVLVIAACGQLTDKICYPAKHRRAFGIGGVTRLSNGYQEYYPYESYSRVDIFAPANPIERADADPGAPPYGTGDGTSYAVPHVVATAAIWLALMGPAIRQKYGTGWKRVEGFRKLLRQTQRQLLFRAPDGCFARALDAEKLVQTALPEVADWDYEEDLAADDRV
jgi:subtilisin family serine protease